MHHTTRPLAFALLAICGSASAAPLDETIRQTLATNPDVRVAVQERLAVDQELRRSRGGYLPSVDATVALGREYSKNPTTRAASTITGSESETLTRRDAALTLRQMIYDGNAVGSEVALNAARADAAGHRVRETSENTSLRVIEVYLEVMRRQQLLDLARENVAKHEDTLEQIKAKSDGGAGSQADVTQTRGRVALAKATMIQARGALLTARNNYIRVVGQPPTELALPDAPSAALLGDLDATLAQALAANPTVNAGQADVSVAQAQRDGADAAFLPRVDFELGSTNNNNVDGVEGVNRDLLAQFRVSYNLFRGGSDTARRAETAERVSQAQQALDSARRGVEETTRIAWDGLTVAKNRMTYLQAHQDAATEVLDAYKKQLKIGQRTLLDVLDSENELFTARSNYVSGDFAIRLGVYRVLAASGLLLDTLGIAQLDSATVGNSETGIPNLF